MTPTGRFEIRFKHISDDMAGPDGPLARIHPPPPCVEYEREALVSALQTRPVWLAACPAAPPDETFP